MRTRVCEMFGIDAPIFAFSRSPDVVVEVTRAGGFGVIAALAYNAPEELDAALSYIDARVEGRPYGVDVVIPAAYAGAEEGGLDKDALAGMLPEQHRAFVDELLARYNVPPLPKDKTATESLLSWTHAKALPLVEVALAHPIRLIANALGPPPRDVIERAHARGIKVAALAGSVKHAKTHVAQGVDIVVAQGYEAGGHTGEVGTFVLVPDVVDAVSPAIVLAAGGVGSGRQIAAAIALGADGVWTGSLWLTTKESDTPAIMKQKLLKATSLDTVRSRAMTGKPARQLKTKWTEAWDAPSSPGALPMPLQFMLTADAVQRFHTFAEDTTTGASELLGQPVGQVVGRMNAIRSTRDVMTDLTTELRATTAELARL